MVNVRFFGVFRLDSGLKEMSAEAGSVKELFPQIIAEAKKINPRTTLTEKDLRGCIIAVNGRQVKPGAVLKDGDEIVLVPAVAGG